MSAPSQQHQFEAAARRVGKAMLTRERIRELNESGDLTHLRSRLSTFLILLDDEIERFGKSRSRAAALAVVLTASFCWQSLRALANRTGDDREWISEALPAEVDGQRPDQETRADTFARQCRIMENAKWIFDLHSALRHPNSENADLILLLREPVGEEVGSRLLSAASEIRQVWLHVHTRLDPTVTVEAAA